MGKASSLSANARMRVAAIVPLALLLAGLACLAAAEQASAATLNGTLASGRAEIGDTRVSLYRAGSEGEGPELLGSARSDGDGAFRIAYDAPKNARSVLYATAGRGAAVRVAATLGSPPFPRRIVLNERTTVATGYALAQFVARGKRIAGSSPGLENAASMAANIANVRNGHLGGVLRRRPNGGQTSALETVNSLSNMLSRCARSARRCSQLFELARPPGGKPPRGTLDATAAIARNPGNHVRRLFKLSRAAPTPFRPALDQSERPDAWTVALRFDGDGKSLDGPGNFAIDAEGNLWVNNNYVYGADPREPRCASDELFKFLPDGSFAPGSPFSGGGLSGAGFGITIAPDDHVWVGNYGFQGVGCTEAPPRNSVSEFSPAGNPISPSASATSTGGYTAGPLSEPQGTVADRDGNIWIANCGNGTVAQYPEGDPSRAILATDIGITSPFGIAINQRGQAFVAGNQNSRVAMLDPDGTPTANSPISGAGIDRPMGLATDSRGNIWVANSGIVLFPCEPPQPPFEGTGSVTLLNGDGVPAGDVPFTGGGVKVPWGITVDGADNVWVANFGRQTVGHICGKRPRNCPPGSQTGDPIAPGSGYGFDGLVRNTGIAVDPSGNVWLANNWLQVPFQTNPGGHEIVALVGAGAPVDTPVIGPPR